MYIDSTSIPIIYLDIGTLTIICSIQKSPPIVSLGKGPSGGGLRPRDHYLFFPHFGARESSHLWPGI